MQARFTKSRGCRWALAAWGALCLGLLVPVHGHAIGTGLSTDVTFRGPVALPGMVLPGGAYTFEMVALRGNDIVRVRSRDNAAVQFLGFTVRVPRPANGSVRRAIVLGESVNGMPPPIVAWYPPDGSEGRAFMYR